MKQLFSLLPFRPGRLLAVMVLLLTLTRGLLCPLGASAQAYTVSTLAGSGAQGAADGPGASASFFGPYEVALDAGGNVYVADANNNKIRKITPGGVVSTLAGTGTIGTADGPGTSASFYNPTGVALDAGGNVYVADADNNKIRKITPGGVVSTLAGSGAQGAADGPGASASFNFPTAVAVDAGGNVYVADGANNKIRKITPGGVVSTLAGSGAQGAADGPGASASFLGLQDVAVDAGGNVYVADGANNKIRKITPGGVVSTLAGSGAQGAADGPGASASFNFPTAVAVDAGGNVYVADGANNKIRKITPGGVVSTLAGSGAQGAADGLGASASFSRVQGVAVDAGGNVYVADYGNNNKIRLVSPVVASPTLTSVNPTSGPVGTSVTLTGTNLTGATSVSFNGTAATFTVVNATTVTATVPTGATTGNVAVTTAGGTSNGVAFTVTTPLAIVSTSPAANANAAPATGPVTVTFNQAVTSGSASALKVFSAQRGGLRTVASGSTTTSSSMVSFAPTYNFRPGETVQATVTTAATAASGGSLATPFVFQITAATVAGSGTFGSKTDYTTAVYPNAVTMGDVNADGMLDVVTANDNGTASVLLGTGTGSFGPKTDYTTGSYPDGVALGDVNGDGKLDLVTANSGDNTASVLLGTSAGTFGPKTDYPTGDQAYGVALGDVNGDGQLDIVTANVNTSSVSVLLGLNAGGFGAPSLYTTNYSPLSVALGDVNGDGRLDIVAGNSSSSSRAYAVSVLLGTGTGSFGPKTDYAVAASAYSVALGDVNGDGNLDLVTGNTGNGTVSVFVGTGTGSFGPKTDFTVGTKPYSVNLSDVNGDARLDIVTANLGNNSVSVLLGAGTGSFAAKVDYTTGASPDCVALGDVNGDGRLDMVAGNSNGFLGNTVSVLLGQATASPSLSSLSPWLGVPGTVLTLTGTNLNGATAITFTGSAGTKTVTAGFTVNGAGTSLTGVVVPAGVQSGSITVTTGGGTSAVVNTVFFSRAKTLAAGADHTVAVRADGTLWAWGRNNFGQLGNGSTTNSTVPVQVGTATNWVSVAGGGYHTVAVRTDGSLWAWGRNVDGELGTGTATDSSVPVQVGTATNWVSAAAGFYHSVAIRADGSLWTWGRNADGQLGNGSTTSSNVPVQVSMATNWVSAAGGANHTVAVRADGSLWAWGNNGSGQLGNGSFTSSSVPVQVGTATSWVSAAAGNYYTVAVRVDGSLWAWGDNTYGQLGNGSTNVSNVPVQVGTATSWVSAAAGNRHTVAVRADGSLWAWGNNGAGQLGNGSTTNSSVPVQVGTATNWVSAAGGQGHTAGEQSCRAVWNWGDNSYGEVGDGTTGGLRTSPVQVYNPVALLTFSPASAAPGATVAVTGTGLAGLSSLSVNGANALSSVANASDTGFTFVVPAGATASGTTTVAAGCGTASSMGFTVTTAPDLVLSTGSLANPTPIPAGTYNSITILNGAVAQFTGAVVVNTRVTVQSGGTLLTNCQALTGPASFTLAVGATLGICDAAGIATSGASGAVQTTGPRSFNADASYAYNGPTAQLTGTGLPSQVRNLSTSNANAVTLSAPVAVTQLVTVGGAGNLVLNGQALTLLSSAAGTALVVNSGTGLVQGTTARVQRYLDPSLNPGLGYRHYSAPVSGATVGSLSTPGFTPVVNPAYNSAPTPGTTTPFPTVFGYDQSRLATAVNNLSAFDKGFVTPSALTDPLVVGQGYVVNLDAGQLVTFQGQLTSGDVALSLARLAATAPNAPEAGWQLVGNPYPAPLDFARIAPADRPNLDAALYVFESTGPYAGAYRSYVNGVGSSSLIGSSQGFFVRVSSGQTSGGLTFRNSQRVTDFGTQVAVRRTAADARPLVQVALRGASGPADVFYAYADAGATPAFDSQYDAIKLPNPTGLNLSSAASSGEALAIDGRPAFLASTVLPLAIGVPAAGTYSLTAASLANLPTGLRVYLTDAQTGQTLALGPGSTYSFSVSAAQATSLLMGRFSLHFSAQSPLATAAALTAEAVSVFPNPAHGRCTVLVPGVTGAARVQATLVNLLGQVVRQQGAALPAAGTQLQLETADLAPGVYTLRLSAGASTLATRLVLY